MIENKTEKREKLKTRKTNLEFILVFQEIILDFFPLTSPVPQTKHFFTPFKEIISL